MYVSHSYGEVRFGFEVVWRFDGFVTGPGPTPRLFGRLTRDGAFVASLQGEASTRSIDLRGSQYSIVLSRP